MVRQKAISFRIYKDLLEELDLESSISGLPRNTLINFAVRLYLEYMDRKRNEQYELDND